MPLRQAIRAIWIVLLFLPPIDTAVGAQIGREAGSDFDLIGLQGEIKPDDVATFRRAADTSAKAVVVLDSGGGAALAGIEMGKLIHLKQFATFVPEDTLCASSCALMWLAGNPREIAPGGAVGFHAAYISQGDGKLMTSGSGNALVGAYLDQIGLSEDVIAYVTHAPPEKMGWLSEGTARAIGLDVVWVGLGVSAGGTSAPQAPRRAGVSPKPYDPVSAVTRFYRALGAADGDTAAALVVPEKRGIGPFNELSMARFFGNMREPLALHSVSPSGADLVVAEYRYVYANGKVCDGRAEVTTAYVFGNTFIQRIKANC
jgi:hypothetical protein